MQGGGRLVRQGLGGRVDALPGRFDVTAAQPPRRVVAIGVQPVAHLAGRPAGELRRPEGVGEGEVAFDLGVDRDAVGIDVGFVAVAEQVGTGDIGGPQQRNGAGIREGDR